MKCHYGIDLPPDGSPCPECKADAHGVCGRLFEAGYKAAAEELRKHARASLLIHDAERGDFLRAADWLDATTPSKEG